jgi:uncharacterized DUF497 family protein
VFSWSRPGGYTGILEKGETDLVFEWDPRKNQANPQKHLIGSTACLRARFCAGRGTAAQNRDRKGAASFSEATSVFGDPLARIFVDEEHSASEHREIIIGHSHMKGLLVVCFTELEGRVWIISAPARNQEGTTRL